MFSRNDDFLREHHDQEEHWVSVSDLMSGLMIIFLLISVIYMVKIESDANKIRKVAILYDRLRIDLYNELLKEFENDLVMWGAELEKEGLIIRFKEPDVLFTTGSHELKPRFKEILDDFFPRYVSIITKQEFRIDIDEVRIEGHTSSFWKNAANKSDAYFNNMGLSQSRTRSTLQYILNLRKVFNEIEWLRGHVTANGLSSSRLIMTPKGKEDWVKSQRVEFKIKTKAEDKIAKILEYSK